MAVGIENSYHSHCAPYRRNCPQNVRAFSAFGMCSLKGRRAELDLTVFGLDMMEELALFKTMKISSCSPTLACKDGASSFCDVE